MAEDSYSVFSSQYAFRSSHKPHPFRTVVGDFSYKDDTVAFPAVEKKAIEQALGRFNEEFRDQPEWAGWDSNKALQFAIPVGSKLYPAKKISSPPKDIAARGVYSYAAEGQVCDMTPTRGNLAFKEHATSDRTLNLFRLGD